MERNVATNLTPVRSILAKTPEPHFAATTEPDKTLVMQIATSNVPLERNHTTLKQNCIK